MEILTIKINRKNKNEIYFSKKLFYFYLKIFKLNSIKKIQKAGEKAFAYEFELFLLLIISVHFMEFAFHIRFLSL